MKLLDKIMQFDTEAKSADENYKQWGTTREAHQEKMLEFIKEKLAEEGIEMDVSTQKSQKSQK